jgi:hypothetical protein
MGLLILRFLQSHIGTGSTKYTTPIVENFQWWITTEAQPRHAEVAPR